MKKISASAILLFLITQNFAQASITNSYTEVKQFIAQLTTQYPQTVKKIIIGNSDSGDVIEALQIGSGAVKNMVVATHHGNEYGSTEVAMAFAKSVAMNPIVGQTVYVIPVLNITGYNERNRYETIGKGGSYDPNRDYPGPCATEGPFKLQSTHALADFINKENIVASATLHTYYPAVVYPWGISTQDLTTPYMDTFKELTRLATLESGYQTGNSTEVIYPADGTFEDYAFWKHGIWSLLFELGFSHTPTDEEVQTMIAQNVPGIRRMLEKAPTARAVDHAFHGKCDVLRMQKLDRHDE